MDREIWQQLLSLESRDIVAIWFEKIHGLAINARRAKEIGASARQAREFFRNGESSHNSVRPLLTFYGVASLARALALLLRRSGGENTLSQGHGLGTINWSGQLFDDVNVAISRLGDLRIKTCSGLFSDLIQSTKNRLCLHIRSSGVDWRLNYNMPALGEEL